MPGTGRRGGESWGAFRTFVALGGPPPAERDDASVGEYRQGRRYDEQRQIRPAAAEGGLVDAPVSRVADCWGHAEHGERTGDEGGGSERMPHCHAARGQREWALALGPRDADEQ